MNTPTIKNQKGFSILEVIVAMGLVGMLSVAVSSTGVLIAKIQGRSKRLADFNSAINYLTSVVQQDTSCAVALGAGTANAPVFSDANKTGTPFDITIYTTNNQPMLKAGNMYGSLPVTQVQLAIDPAQPPNATGPNTLYVGNISLQAKDSPSNATKDLKNAPLMTYNHSRITLKVETATSKLISCTALRLGDQTPYSLPSCGPNQSVVGDGTRIACIQTSCPPLTPLVTFRYPNGQVTCGAINSTNCTQMAEGVTTCPVPNLTQNNQGVYSYAASGYSVGSKQVRSYDHCGNSCVWSTSESTCDNIAGCPRRFDYKPEAVNYLLCCPIL